MFLYTNNTLLKNSKRVIPEETLLLKNQFSILQNQSLKNRLIFSKASSDPVAKKYLLNRKIDPDKFYFADKFMEWTNTQKRTFDTITKDESRIVIPMYSSDKNLIGFQGRALGKSFTKYITVMLERGGTKSLWTRHN